MKKLIEFLKNKKGISSVEYGILLGLIAAVIVTGLMALSNAVVEKYQEVTDYVNQ